MWAWATCARAGGDPRARLAGLPDADLRITLEIAADVPSGAPEKVVRIVTENGRTLKVDGGFEG